MIHVDTHVLAWLFAGRDDLFPAAALAQLETEELVCSPMVILELQYLYEIERVTQPGKLVVDDLARRLGLRVSDAPFDAVITSAQQQSWTRDPFDRIIAGHAAAENVPLLTKDDSIRANYHGAIWDE